MGKIQGHVARLMRTASWNFIRDNDTAASAHATCRPDGRWFVSIDAWDEEAHAPLLDVLCEDLRHDLHMNLSADDEHGLERWRNDPAEFREYTFDERRFDPATYLVAVDDSAQEFAGLVRVWTQPRHSRLGLIGTVASWGRSGRPGPLSCSN